MKHFVVAFGIALIAAPLAHATPISASININGSDSFTNSTITFPANAPSPAFPSEYVVSGSSVNGATVTPGTVVTFASGPLTYTPAFSSQAGFQIASFMTGGNLVSIFVQNEMGNYFTTTVGTTLYDNLVFSGTGFIRIAGYTDTPISFNLTTQQVDGSGMGTITGFSASSFAAATPEPSSLMLLGTGLVSAAGMLVRRRRVV